MSESFGSECERLREQIETYRGEGSNVWWPSFMTGALEALQEAHDRQVVKLLNEINKLSTSAASIDQLRAAYHEGYTAALRRRETETWQLDQERMEAVRRLREFHCEDIEQWFDMQFWTLMKAVGLEHVPALTADCDDVAHLRDRLIHLLGGDSNLQKSPNPINKDAESESYLIESAEFNKLDDRENVVRKLQALQFDGGSHENLSKIAYAIYPCATGWTCESAKGLRDSLVRLIGGDDGGCGVSEHVRNSDKSDDDSDSHSELAEEITAYDVLGNERQKAVCELRELSERGNVWGRELIVALGLSVNATNDDMCDRLIHLLGGDQPSGIDVLRAMDADGTSPNDDGICPNDDQILSITNELREWASTEVPYKYGRQLHAIADHIDEQFIRICEQQEAVLQSTIDRLVDERDHIDAEHRELRRKLLEDCVPRDEHERQLANKQAYLDHANAENHRLKRAAERDADHIESLTSALNDAERERDELKEHCRNQQKQLAEFNRVMNTWHWDIKSHKQWCPMSLDRAIRKAEEKWEAACGRIGELNDERNHLLRELARLSDERDRYKAACEANHDQINRLKNAHLDKTLEVAALTEECDMYLDLLRDARNELEEQRDKLKRECNLYKDACEVAQSLAHDMMDGLEDYIELPKDANGEHVRPGDALTDGEYTFAVDEVAYDGEIWSVRNNHGFAWSPCDVYHVSEEEES